MPNTSRSIFLALLLLVASATRVAAQDEATALPGELVRFDIVGPASAAVGRRCLGRVTDASLDTLIVGSAERCGRGSYLADLRVVRGDRGSRLTHVGYGALAGGLVGAVVARFTGVECNGRPCVAGEKGAVSTNTLLTSAALGGLVGGIVGYVWPSGPLWVRAGARRPLRVKD